LFTILNALIELAAPYFYKIAIDRYILATWTEVRLTRLSASERETLKPAWPENCSWKHGARSA